MRPGHYVRRGAKALDKLCGKVGVIPCDWRERIDLDRLDLSSETWCVLGQLGEEYDGSDYDAVVHHIGQECQLDDEWQWAAEHGFASNAQDYRREYDGLTAAWRRYLTRANTDLGKRVHRERLAKEHASS